MHHFIVSSTEAEAAVEAPLPPALQHLTLHCDLSEHGIGVRWREGGGAAGRGMLVLTLLEC